MPRPLRIIDADSYYHITNRGTNKQEVFHDREDYVLFERLFEKIVNSYDLNIFNHSLMPNHTHIITRSNDQLLSEAMHDLFNIYTKYHHKKYQNSGCLWQGRFRSNLIKDDHHLYAAGLYIELNPVRAGLVRSPLDWEFSSCQHYCGMKEKSFITDNPLYPNLGITQQERQAKYLSALKSHYPDMMF